MFIDTNICKTTVGELFNLMKNGNVSLPDEDGLGSREANFLIHSILVYKNIPTIFLDKITNGYSATYGWQYLKAIKEFMEGKFGIVVNGKVFYFDAGFSVYQRLCKESTGDILSLNDCKNFCMCQINVFICNDSNDTLNMLQNIMKSTSKKKKKFSFLVKEHLTKKVEIEAYDREEARRLLLNKIYDKSITLNGNDFNGERLIADLDNNGEVIGDFYE